MFARRPRTAAAADAMNPGQHNAGHGHQDQQRAQAIAEAVAGGRDESRVHVVIVPRRNRGVGLQIGLTLVTSPLPVTDLDRKIRLWSDFAAGAENPGFSALLTALGAGRESRFLVTRATPPASNLSEGRTEAARCVPCLFRGTDVGSHRTNRRAIGRRGCPRGLRRSGVRGAGRAISPARVADLLSPAGQRARRQRRGPRSLRAAVPQSDQVRRPLQVRHLGARDRGAHVPDDSPRTRTPTTTRRHGQRRTMGTATANREPPTPAACRST